MSLKEIAKRTGTSVATVSRVLNHPEHHCNDLALQERIWAVASELSYVPNQTARNLRKGEVKSEQPMTIDFFLTRFETLDVDDFFLELYTGLKDELMQNNCALGEVISAVDMVQLMANPNTITTKKNHGLIILGKCPAQMIEGLHRRYAYLVGIDRNPTDYEYDEVVCNGISAAEKAMDYLVGLGHRQIAYIGDCSYEARYIGYYQSLLKHKIPLNYQHVQQTNQTREEGMAAMQKILGLEQKPSAIFCANDSTALGVLQAYKKRKEKNYVPSIISIDNIEASMNTEPMLTTIDIPKKEMAHFALMLLLDRRKKGHSEKIRIELPCRLIERESCMAHHS